MLYTLSRLMLVIPVLWIYSKSNTTWMLSHIKICFIALIQLIYLIIMSTVRPMHRIQENIIQICNDAILFVLFSMLIYFDREERWKSWTETAYIYIMVSGNILSALIVLGTYIFIFLIVSGIINICKRIMTRNRENQIKVRNFKNIKIL